MSVVIRTVNLEGWSRSTASVNGQWLESYEPDAFGPGKEQAVFTNNINDAMQFPSIKEAFEFYRQQSKTHPIRKDGKANRPLTAFTVTFDNVPEEEVK